MVTHALLSSQNCQAPQERSALKMHSLVSNCLSEGWEGKGGGGGGRGRGNQMLK